MSTLDLLAVGDAFEDLVFLGLPRLPRSGEEIKTGAFLRTVGGGAVITAVAAARLGLRCRVVAGLGRFAAKRLQQEPLSVVNVCRPNEACAVTAALSTASDRSFVTFTGANEAIESRLWAALRRRTARHVHFALQPQHCEKWLPIVAHLRRRGVTTSWDFGWSDRLLEDARFSRLAGAVDYLLMNAEEARLYARKRRLADSVEHWRRAAATAIIKLGEHGSRWVSRSLDLLVPAPRVRAIDSTGAGDAFNGGFLYALLQERPPRACLRTGNLVGALSTRSAGGLDGLPRRADLARRS